MVKKGLDGEIIIRTPRLLIRSIRPEDADFIWDVRTYRMVYKWTMAGQWHVKAQATEWVNKALASETGASFMIELLPQPNTNTTSEDSSASTQGDPTIIGSIGLHEDNELGYIIHPDYWGKGYATEVLSAFVAMVWEKVPDAQVLSAWVDVENAGSMGVLRKCGFKEVKRMPYESVTLGERVNAIFEATRPV